MVSQKTAFLFALIATILVFAIGIFIGFTIENIRNSLSYQAYINSETELFDIRLQSSILETFPIKNCDVVSLDNLRLADKIYEESKILGNYEKANEISQVTRFEHKKFDLLRALLWINSVKIKEKCNSSYVDIVYIYQYNKPDIEKRALQSVYSNLLMEAKNKYGGAVLLIPLAGDNNLTSIESLRNYYNITSLPTILINENVKITDLISLDELSKIIDNEL